jgi:hypothetical protein
MPIPTFNGTALFDTAVVMTTASCPVQVQKNAYPQLDGLEVVNLGSRGRVTEVRGYLTGPDLTTLAAKAAAWRSLQESVMIGPLVTTDGSTYPYTYICAFHEAGRILTMAGGGVMRPYLATLLHLV